MTPKAEALLREVLDAANVCPGAIHPRLTPSSDLVS